MQIFIDCRFVRLGGKWNLRVANLASDKTCEIWLFVD